MNKYLIVFEEIMEEIDLLDSIINFQNVRKHEMILSETFIKSILKFKNQDNKKVKNLYKKIYKEKEDVSKLGSALDELLNVLKIIVNINANSIQYDFLYLISGRFKEKLKEYILQFDDLKKNFLTLINVSRKISKVKTR